MKEFEYAYASCNNSRTYYFFQINKEPIDLNSRNKLEIFNELGSQGWEYTSTLTGQHWFKRCTSDNCECAEHNFDFDFVTLDNDGLDNQVSDENLCQTVNDDWAKVDWFVVIGETFHHIISVLPDKLIYKDDATGKPIIISRKEVEANHYKILPF